MPTCGDCGGTTIEYDAAGFCVVCGTVVEENTIVAEVTFGETSNGGAMVRGSYVGPGQTRARINGPGGFRDSGESREQTVANETYGNHKVVVDFSDILQVNVFVLGMTYLRLVQMLNIKLPLVDPTHYIHRFAALLEFGDETGKVATDAVRLVQRFNRDWMTAGPRPAGICGACILLAARMNNFRRSVQEIVQVVKIADVTLKKRLEEFKSTSSGSLTVDDFRKVWLEEEMDPPAFAKGREMRKAKVMGSKKRKRNNGEESRESCDEEQDDGDGDDPGNFLAVDPALFNQGILAGTSDTPAESRNPLFLPDPEDERPRDSKGDDLFRSEPPTQQNSPSQALPSIAPFDETVDSFLTEEVTEYIKNEQGSLLSDALDTAQRRRQAAMTAVDELVGLEEDELDHMLLNNEEVKLKERVELNRDYLENLAEKAIRQQNGESCDPKPRKRRKIGSNKPRDASNAHGATAAESVRCMVTNSKKFSRKINYLAYDTLFGALPATDTGQDKDADDDGLYHMDDKSDAEGMVVIEEPGGGGIGSSRKRVNLTSASRRTQGGGGEGEGNATGHASDDDQDAECEKDDDAWGVVDDADPFEQEV